MKLRNKKTGEIGDLVLNICPNRESYAVLSTENGDTLCGNLVIGDYNSLAELTEEWEEYEEPKGINEIDIVLDAISEYCNEHSYYSGDLEKIKILNIVEDKLRAYKRLKDKGFRFIGLGNAEHIDCCGAVLIEASIDSYSDAGADLDLLFGGEE